MSKYAHDRRESDCRSSGHGDQLVSRALVSATLVARIPSAARTATKCMLNAVVDYEDLLLQGQGDKGEGGSVGWGQLRP